MYATQSSGSRLFLSHCSPMSYKPNTREFLKYFNSKKWTPRKNHVLSVMTFTIGTTFNALSISVVFNVGDRPLGGDFCRLKRTKILNWFQKILLWNQNIWCSFDSMVRNKIYRHMISDWWRNNQTNIVLCNASLHQLSKTTEYWACLWLGVKYCGSQSHEDYECVQCVVLRCV